ncbi:hypothetical protein BKA63DRAFT_594848 [Paraphoma chrysanthemicola]|nr:hypothetical protein BKA63DRAFT_594848 [Paraphoma chrysanthemicola]
MASSSRLDSPIKPSFTRKLSDPVTSPGRIAERPQNPQTSLRGPSRPSASHNLHHQYTPSCGPPSTSLNSPLTFSTTTPNPFAPSSSFSTTASAPSHPYEPLPSSSNSSTLTNVTQPVDTNCDNWSEGWSISSVDEMIDTKSLKRNSLPYIAENDFLYYPKRKEEVQSYWSDEEEETKEGRVKMMGRKLEKGERSGEGLREWLRRTMRKLNSRR